VINGLPSLSESFYNCVCWCHQFRPGTLTCVVFSKFTTSVLMLVQIRTILPKPATILSLMYIELLLLLYRCMYPGGHGQYTKLSDCGLLRLHSTYRHDLKIYASDEGRVQMTAAAFAKVLN